MYKSEKTKDEFELIPDGVYEAVASDVKERPSFDGTSVQLEIVWRLVSNNRVFFDHINKDKQFPTDYSHWKVSNILFACGCPDANSTDDLIKSLKGKKAKITMTSQFYDKTGKTYNRITDYSPLEKPVKANESESNKDMPTTDSKSGEFVPVGEPKEVKGKDDGAIDVSSDDLPF
jgi:hypothetical protein